MRQFENEQPKRQGIRATVKLSILGPILFLVLVFSELILGLSQDTQKGMLIGALLLAVANKISDVATTFLGVPKDE